MTAFESDPVIRQRWRVEMLAAYEAQDGICAICGRLMPHPRKFEQRNLKRPTREHVIPRSLGGLDELGNIVASCWGCNSRKSDSPPTGCTLIFLLAVNARLGVEPVRW